MALRGPQSQDALREKHFADNAEQIRDLHPEFAGALDDIATSPEFQFFSEVAVGAYLYLIEQVLQQEILGPDGEPIDLDMLYRILFLQNPEGPDEDTVAGYSVEHMRIYKERAIRLAWEIINDPTKVTIIDSGMYGGKTTLLALTATELQRQGYEITYLVAEALGVEQITARALGEDIPATPFGQSTYQDILQRLHKHREECSEAKLVVVVDEYPFVPSAIVQGLRDFCQQNNIVLIMAGLNYNYVGFPFPIRDEQINKRNTRVENCHSFVHGFNDKPPPRGTHSNRYIGIPGQDGTIRWLRDLGIAPVVLSRDHPFVKYTPSLPEHEVLSLFAETSFIEEIQDLAHHFELGNPIGDRQQRLADSLARRWPN